MITPAMRKVELHILKGDLVRVLEYLGKQACMQIPRAGRPGAAASPSGALFRELQDLRRYLGLPDLEAMPADTVPPDAFRREEAGQLLQLAARQREDRDGIEARLDQLRLSRHEAGAFAGLGVPITELSRVSFLVLRVGRLPADRRGALRAALGQRAVVLDLDGERVLALAARKERLALDEALAREGFLPAAIPPGFAGLPDELLAALDAAIAGAEREAAAMEEARQALAAACRESLPPLLAAFAMGMMIEELGASLEATAHVCRLEGWLPAADLDRVTADLELLGGDRIAIRAFEPRELATVRDGSEPVPVLLRHGRLVASFERLVVSYGTPLYGTIDPTPFVATFFILLFALMFGDLGQGALILAAGWLVARGRIRALGRFKAYAPILMACGGASMVTGLLYGSFFSNERLLVPFGRLVSGWFGPPADRLVAVLPNEGFARLLWFFAFTLAIGAVLNSIGLVINICNQLRLGRWREGLFGKTGLAGALFFWYGLGFGLRLALGGAAAWGDLAGFLLPLLAMGLGPGLLERWRTRRRTGPAAAPAGTAEPVTPFGFAIELVETIAYYLSNTVSFLRVGAFALAHAVLSLATFILADLVGAVAGGPVFSLLVVVTGNLVILVLEGMIVVIQVTRLHYYEFFSKFLTATGEEFRPFRFVYKGVGP